MGLTSGTPGRKAAEEEPARYRRVQALVEQFRRGGARAEAAEWVLFEIAPLVEEFFDDAEMRAWRDEAASALAQEYAKAGVADAPEGLPGLLEARVLLAEAMRAPDAVAMSRAEEALKYVLHRTPDAGAAVEGLARLKTARPVAPQRAVDARSVEEKLAALADVCRWPEKTREGVCMGCPFPDRVTEGGVTKVVGCLYRMNVVTPLARAAGQPIAFPESEHVVRIFGALAPGERARVAAEVERLASARVTP